MPKTRIAKGDWKDFLSYNKWMYILIAIIAWMGADILFSSTEYRSPDERQVAFQMVAQGVNVESRLPEVGKEALAAGQAFDETLEEVVFYALEYNPDNDSDGYGGQKYMLMLGVGEGDIYVVKRSLMRSLVSQGYALPLEGYIATGLLDPGDVDLEAVTFPEPETVDDYDPNVSHVYAIPAVNCNAMLEPDINYDNRDAYFVLLGFSGNPDTSVAVLNDVIRQLTAPLPEWAENLSAGKVSDDGSVFESALQNAGYATPAPTEPVAEFSIEPAATAEP